MRPGKLTPMLAERGCCFELSGSGVAGYVFRGCFGLILLVIEDVYAMEGPLCGVGEDGVAG